MKKSVRLLSLILCVAMILPTSVVTGVGADTFNFGDYQYQPKTDGVHCTVTKYSGTETEIVIPATMDGYAVQELGASLFSGKNTITSVTVPEGVTVINNSAFYNCKALTQVTLPETLDWIKYYAFGNCTALTEIHLPDSITKMSAYAFGYCSNLISINYPQNWEYTYSNSNATVTNYKQGYSPFIGCSKLTSVTVPEGVKNIAPFAFKNVPLTSVEFPSTLEWIKSCAFWGTALTEITLPDSVRILSGAAFADCKSVKTITLSKNLEAVYDHKDAPSTGLVTPSPFGGCSACTAVILPEGMKILPNSCLYVVRQNTFLNSKLGTLISGVPSYLLSITVCVKEY